MESINGGVWECRGLLAYQTGGEAFKIAPVMRAVAQAGAMLVLLRDLEWEGGQAASGGQDVWTDAVCPSCKAAPPSGHDGSRLASAHAPDCKLNVLLAEIDAAKARD